MTCAVLVFLTWTHCSVICWVCSYTFLEVNSGTTFKAAALSFKNQCFQFIWLNYSTNDLVHCTARPAVASVAFQRRQRKKMYGYDVVSTVIKTHLSPSLWLKTLSINFPVKTLQYTGSISRLLDQPQACLRLACSQSIHASSSSHSGSWRKLIGCWGLTVLMWTEGRRGKGQVMAGLLCCYSIWGFVWPRNVILVFQHWM